MIAGFKGGREMVKNSGRERVSKPNRHIIRREIAVDHRGRLRRLEYHATKGWRSYAA